MNLDEPGGFGAVDRADALADVEDTAGQWREARELATVRLDLADVDAVVIAGMGGSGIAGDVAAVLAADRLGLPVLAHKGYGLPAHVGKRTLVAVMSYSGNTEESLSAFDTARTRGAQLFAVTSGGQIGRAAAEAGIPVVSVPGGRQPRHSLGYLAVPLLVALGLDEDLDEAVAVQEEVAGACARDLPSAENPAKQIAQRIAGGGILSVIGAEGLGATAAYRLKCQLNENAKLTALCAVLPEANHNEIVGWQEPGGLAASGLLVLRDPAGEHPRVTERFRVTGDLAAEAFAWTEQLDAHGESTLARLASLLLLADLVSVYTALALDRDPTPIPFIDHLKTALAGDAVSTDGGRRD